MITSTSSAVRFDAAINPYGCSPRVVQALHEAVDARAYRHYGDIDAASLRDKLAAHHDLSPENFVVYPGSGQAHVWQCITRLMLPRGVFLCPFPSYERFVDVGRRCARAVHEVALEPGTWALPLAAFLEAAREHEAALAMISNPNNPTGNRLLDEGSLEALLTGAPACTFVIDEAYAEYTGASVAPWVARFPNLVVLKTFSKAYGLAGLRVGYLVAQEKVAAAMRAFQIPWAVDTLALVAAEAALDDQSYLRQAVTQIRADVRTLATALEALAFARVSPTCANFLLLELLAGTGADLAARLQERGLIVRQRADLPAYVRVTSMLPDDNARLLATLQSLIGQGRLWQTVQEMSL